MDKVIYGIFAICNGTSKEWEETDPVLEKGEIGYDSSTNRLKVGDGESRWSKLDWVRGKTDINNIFAKDIGIDKINTLDSNNVQNALEELMLKNNTNVESIESLKQNKTNKADEKMMVEDFSFKTNGDEIFATVNKYNAGDLTDNTSAPDKKVLPLATDTTAGAMSPSDYAQIRANKEAIERLDNDSVRLLYTEKENPTAEEIDAFVISKGYKTPYKGVAVVVDKTFNIWHFYEGGIGWHDDGIDTVIQFTNDKAGIIKGANIDGKVYAETDGTGSVKGWNAVKTDITDLQNKTNDIRNNLDTKLDKTECNLQFNQLIDPFVRTRPDGNIVFTYKDGTLHIKGKENSQHDTLWVVSYDIKPIQNHIYYFKSWFVGPSQGLQLSYYLAPSEYLTRQFYCHLSGTLNKDIDIKLQFILIDLTEMFGKGNEPKTNLEVEKYIKPSTYYPYQLPIREAINKAVFRKFNQLLSNKDIKIHSNLQPYSTIIDNGIILDFPDTQQYNGKVYEFNFPINHTYYVDFMAKFDRDNRCGFYIWYNGAPKYIGEGANACSAIIKPTKDFVALFVNNLNTNCKLTVTPMIIDLTTMFGKGNEPQTKEEVYKYIEPGKYYPYTNNLATVGYVDAELDKKQPKGNYLTEHQDISGKADITYVDKELDKKLDKTECNLQFNQVLQPNIYKTSDNRGLIVTNNNDGSIDIVNNNYFDTGRVISNAFPLVKSHTYYFNSNRSIDNKIVCSAYFDNSGRKVNESITTNDTQIKFFATEFPKNVTLTNNFSPILVDLTEMFGAGKEPQSIEEVQKYIKPNTYYPYTPIPLESYVSAKDVQNFTDIEKHQAQQNLFVHLKKNVLSNGWYKICKISNSTNCEINLSGIFESAPPTSCKLIINRMYISRITLTTIGYNMSSRTIDKVRLVQSTGDVEIHMVAGGNNRISYEIKDDINSTSIKSYDFEADTINHTSDDVIELEIKNGINTTGDVFVNNNSLSTMIANNTSAISGKTDGQHEVVNDNGNYNIKGYYILTECVLHCVNGFSIINSQGDVVLTEPNYVGIYKVVRISNKVIIDYINMNNNQHITKSVDLSGNYFNLNLPSGSNGHILIFVGSIKKV